MSPAGNKALQAGYTLLELLVVVAILAIAVSALSVGFSAPGKRSDLETATRQLEADMDALTTAALADGKVRIIRFDQSKRQYSWGETVRTLPGAVAMEVKTMPRSSPPSITLFPNGRNSGADVTLRDGGDEMRLRASWLTGAIGGSE